jgi:putative membrane protein
MHAIADCVVRPVLAHGLAASAVSRWDLNPLVVMPLAITAIFYVLGLARVWRRAGIGRGISRWSVASFGAGWVVMLAALVSPVAWLSDALFSVHMTQHVLLMLVAAPLLTFGHPILAWMWALGDAGREHLAQAVRAPHALRAWRDLTRPLVVFLVQAAVIWGWHIPRFYEAALHSDAIHAIEHVSLVVSASLFWWAMVRGRYGRGGYGLGVLYVFLTALHSSALGALLTVSPSLWYGEYGRQAAVWRIDALADQQLAGLLMWIPAGVIFIVFGLTLVAGWLGEAERRVRFGATDRAARRLLALLLAAALTLTACGSSETREAENLTGGNVRRGFTAVDKYGCAACHTIPRVDAAPATVGPPLDRIARRHYLGGHLPNTPGNMIKWIQHPQAIDPKNIMPELGVTDQDARDIAALLYTSR